MPGAGQIVPAAGQAWEGEADFTKNSPPTTPPDNNNGKKLPALKDKKKKKGKSIGNTADKYEAAKSKLFGTLSVKREPDAPKSMTLEETLAAEKLAAQGGGDPDLEDDEIELTSLAPPPHIDVVVQKQEHRLDSLDEVVDARLRVWTWKHIAALTGAVWCTTICLGMIIGSLIYGLGLREGSVDMGVLYSEGIEIGPEGDDEAEAYMFVTASMGQTSKIALGDGNEGEEYRNPVTEATLYTDMGNLPLPRLGGVSGGVPGRGVGARFTITHNNGGRVLVAHQGGAQGGGGAGDGTNLALTSERHVVLSPNNEAGAVHVGGALGVHGGLHVVDGGMTMLGNSTAATVYSCDESDPQANCPAGSAVAIGGDEMISIDAGKRSMSFGGPGSADIRIHGGVSIDATDAEGVIKPITLSNLHVTGSGSIGTTGADSMRINSAVTATSNFIIDPIDESSFVRVGSNSRFTRDLNVDGSTSFGTCESEMYGPCPTSFKVNATAEFARMFIATESVYLGDEPSDYLRIAGAGHFTNTLRVDADVFLGMDGESTVEVGSNAEFGKDMKVSGDMQIGGGTGMLPETDLHVMRVYSDATFRGIVDMRGDVTIGNNFNEDRLEIWSSTVVNNFAIQLLGDALIGDRKTDVMTVKATAELFERVETHNAVILGTDYVCPFPASLCEYLEVHMPGRFHSDMSVAGAVVLGDHETDSVTVEGNTKMKGTLEVYGNLTLASGTVECFDESEYCYSMTVLDPTYCLGSQAEMNCQLTCGFCSAEKDETRMTVVSSATFQSSVTLEDAATLFARGDAEVSGVLSAKNDSVFGESSDATATFLAETMHRGHVFVEADMTVGSLDEPENETTALLIHSDTTSTGLLSTEGDATFGDEEGDMNTFGGRASFLANVSLGLGNSTVTSDSEAIFRAPFSAVGTSVRLGDNATTDTVEITAETHFHDGTLYAHGDSQVGDTALCTNDAGIVVARGDTTNPTKCERTGYVWNADTLGCLTEEGGDVVVLENLHTLMDIDAAADTVTISAAVISPGYLWTHLDSGMALQLANAPGETCLASPKGVDLIVDVRTDQAITFMPGSITGGDAAENCILRAPVIPTHQAEFCEFTGNTYTDDKLVVEALSTFNGDVLIGAGADMQVGRVLDDGTMFDVLGVSRFMDNVTLGGDSTRGFLVNPPTVFNSEFDVGGAVALHGPTFVVDGNSTLINPVVAESDMTIGLDDSKLLYVGAESQFAGNSSFLTNVRFQDPGGVGGVVVNVARDVDFVAEGDGILGTSSEDQFVVHASTRTTAPLQVVAAFTVENATAVSLGETTLPWFSVNAANGRVDMRADVHVQGKFYSGSEFDLLSVRCNSIDSRVVDDGYFDQGVLVEGVRMLNGGFPDQLKVSNIGEYVDGSGVLIDNVWLKDGVAVFESAIPGFSPKGTLDMLTLINSGYHADMDGTAAALEFMQFFYHTNQINHEPDNSARIAVTTETDWTEDPLTRDASLGIFVTQDGELNERLHVRSNGDVTILNDAGVPVVALTASDGSVAAQNNLVAGGDLTVTGALSTLSTAQTVIDATIDIELQYRRKTALRLSDGLLAFTENNVLTNASRVVQLVDSDFTLKFFGGTNDTLAPTQYMDSQGITLSGPTVTLEGMEETKLRGHLRGVGAIDPMHCYRGIDSVGGPVHLFGESTAVFDASDTVQIKQVHEACVARDAEVCANVALNGNPTTCTNAGECTHTPASTNPTVAESCVATDAVTCSGVELDGTEATCTSQGLCIYTAGGSAVIEIDNVGTTLTDEVVTMTGTTSFGMAAELFTVSHTSGGTPVMKMDATGLEFADSTISMTGTGGIEIEGGGGGTVFTDTTTVNSNFNVKTANCGDGTACSGTANIDSNVAIINGQTSVAIASEGTNVLTIADAGTTLDDDIVTLSALSATGEMNLLSEGTLTLRYGTMSDPAVLTIDTDGTTVLDSVVSLVATDQVTLAASNGVVSLSEHTFESGLVLTGGRVQVDATTTIAMNAATSTIIGATETLKLQHGDPATGSNEDVLVIEDGGTVLTDNIIAVAATDTMLLAVEDTFTLSRTGDDPGGIPVINVNGASGTVVRDDQIGLMGTQQLYFSGGTLGSTFQDSVYMLGGGDAPGGDAACTDDADCPGGDDPEFALKVGSTYCRASGPSCGLIDAVAHSYILKSWTTLVVQAEESYTLKHGDDNVLAVDSTGSLFTDDVIRVEGSTSATIQSDGSVLVMHGTDEVMKIDSTETYLTDGKIRIAGQAGSGIFGIEISTPGTCTGTQSADSDGDGSFDCALVAAFVSSAAESDCPVSDGCVFGQGTGTLFHDEVTVRSSMTVLDTSGDVSMRTNTAAFRGESSVKVQRTNVETCLALDAVACAAVALDGSEATCTSAGACDYTAVPEACVATDIAACTTFTDEASCLAAGRCYYTAAGSADIFSTDAPSCTGTQSADSDGDGSLDCALVAAFVSSAAESDCPVSDGCIYARGGTLMTDYSISAEATSAVSVASPSFKLRQGTAADSVVMRVDAEGTLLHDSTIGLTGDTGIIVRGGSPSCKGTQTTDTDSDGSLDCAVIAAFVASGDQTDCPSGDGCVFSLGGSTFQDLVTMEAGLTISAGAVDVTSDSSVSVAATGTMTLGSDTSVTVQHEGADVIAVTSTGTVVTDDNIGITGSDALSFTIDTGGFFNWYRGAGTQPVMTMRPSNGGAMATYTTLKDQYVEIGGTQIAGPGHGNGGVRISGYSEFTDLATFAEGIEVEGGPLIVASDNMIHMKADSSGRADGGGESCIATAAAICARTLQGGIFLSGDADTCLDGDGCTSNDGYVTCEAKDAAACAAASLDGTREACLNAAGVTGTGCTYIGNGQISLDAAGSLYLRHGSVDVVSISAAGTAVEDDAVSITGSSSVSMAAGAEFSLTHGSADCTFTAGDAASCGVDCTYTAEDIGNGVTESCIATKAIRITSDGFAMADSTVSITATTGISFTGGTGSRFYDTVTMDDGLTISAGAVDVSTSTTEFSASDTFSISHGGSAVIAITATGTAVSDSAVEIIGTTSLGLGTESAGTISVTHGADTTLEISAAGTTVTDDVVTVAASTRFDVTGGTEGSVFTDAVNIKGGTTLEDALTITGGTQAVEADVDTVRINGATSFAVQNADSDVISISGVGTVVTDDAITATGSTSVSMTAGSTFQLIHSNDAATCLAAVLPFTNIQSQCAAAGSSAGACSYTPADSSNGLADSCTPTTTSNKDACEGYTPGNAASCTAAGTGTCAHTPADPANNVVESCVDGDISACAEVSSQKECEGLGTCSYTARDDRTSVNGVAQLAKAEACTVTDAMRIDSNGMVLQDSYINLKADQIDLTTGTFNVPVDLFTVDGPNGVKFQVSGDTGDTIMRGDVTIGGAGVAGERAMLMASYDDSVVATFQAADATKDATIRLTDAGGANAFDIKKDDTVLTIMSHNNAGVIDVNPGVTGQLRVGTDKLTVHGGTGATTIRGDTTIGGAAITEARQVSVVSNNDDVTLTLTAGGDGENAKLQWGDGVHNFDMNMLQENLVLSATEDDGRIQINPGAATGRLTVGPLAGPNVVIDAATANTEIGGTLTVAGRSNLAELGIETGLATGNSLQTIDKATGILTSDSTTLSAFVPGSGSTVEVVEIVLNNNRVSATSVVMANIVRNCNDNTLLTVVSTVPFSGNGRVTFKVANVGSASCATGETFDLAFVVLN
jgi:hypothetical protein